MGEQFKINSDKSFVYFSDQIKKRYEEHRYLIVDITPGMSRSLTMNSLFHVWVREIVKAKGKSGKTVEEGTKRDLKRVCYQETSWDFMITEIKSAISDNKKMDYASTADLSQGQMYNFMNWIQAFAARHGVILESKGEHQLLKGEGNA